MTKKEQIDSLYKQIQGLQDQIKTLEDNVNLDNFNKLVEYFKCCKFYIHEPYSVTISIKENLSNEFIKFIYSYCGSHHGDINLTENILLYAGDGGAIQLNQKENLINDLIIFLKNNGVKKKQLFHDYDAKIKNYYKLAKQEETNKEKLEETINSIFDNK